MAAASLKQKLLATAFSLSAIGAVTIMNHEGVERKAYVDPVGVVTVCAGHTRTAKLGQVKTLAQCEQLLKEDTTVAEKYVKRLVTVPLTQGQYDSLVSFTFNVGGGNLGSSTLLRKLNAGDCFGAANQFDRWHYAKGRSLPGLVIRRADERMVFESGCLSPIQLKEGP